MKIRKLKKELQRKAEEELNEVPARMEEDVQHIREWLHGQPHLCFPDDDQTIVLFLRLCKYRLNRTKERIDNFCSVVPRIPEVWTNRDPLSHEIQAILNANIFATLPIKEDAVGPRTLMIRVSKCNPETMSVINLKKVCIMIMYILINEDDITTIGGLSLFIDFEGFPLSYILQINLGLMERLLSWLRSSSGLRIKQMTFVNASSAVETLYNSFKHLLSDKLGKRVNIYSKGNSFDICKEFSHSILPKEYGGNAASYDELAAVWKEKLENYRASFLDDKIYYVHEELRPGRSKASEVGMEGSFRKLAID